MSEDVKVSVYCLAYNHEKYIRKTLEGFVNQNTTFKYKVMVHDDASTDATADIIREYESKYPDLIEAIYQQENQYSKNKDIVKEFLEPHLVGKYIASCEGDDYWTDSDKLQKQYDIMEHNPEMSICLHRVSLISEEGTELRGTYPSVQLNSGYLSAEELIHLICVDFFQLSSFFYRADLFHQYYNYQPIFAAHADVGDIPLLLYMATQTKWAYYFDRIMSCYRLDSCSSVVKATATNDEKQIRHLKCIQNMITLFDEYTYGEYHEKCEEYKDREKYETCLRLKDIVSILENRKYREKFKQLPLRTKLSIFVKGFLKRIK